MSTPAHVARQPARRAAEANVVRGTTGYRWPLPFGMTLLWIFAFGVSTLLLQAIFSEIGTVDVPRLTLEAALLAFLIATLAYYLAAKPAVSAARADADRVAAQLDVLNRTAIVAVTDARGRIIEVNGLFCQISGYSRSELLGRTHGLLNSGIHSRRFFADMYRTIATGQIWQGEICNRARDDSLYWVDTRIIPTIDSAGRILTYTAIRIDITARKLAEAEFAALQQRHELAMQGSRMCLWEWNLLTDAVEVSGPWAMMLGYPAEHESAPRLLESLFDAADADGLRRQIAKHSRGEIPQLEHEVRLRRENGDILWVRMRGIVISRDSNGLALRAAGQLFDVTATKEAAVRVEHSEALLATILDVLPQRVFWKDRDGRFLGVNKALREDAGTDEITEQAAVKNLAHANTTIKRLSAVGCRFSLDDFGTGSNSLTYLKALQIGYVKFDGSFVRDILTSTSPHEPAIAFAPRLLDEPLSLCAALRTATRSFLSNAP